MNSEGYYKKREFYDHIIELDIDWVQERFPWGRDVILRMKDEQEVVSTVGRTTLWTVSSCRMFLTKTE